MMAGNRWLYVSIQCILKLARYLAALQLLSSYSQGDGPNEIIASAGDGVPAGRPSVRVLACGEGPTMFLLWF